MELIEVNDINDERLQIYKTMRANAFDKEGSFVADSEKVVLQVLDVVCVGSQLTGRFYWVFAHINTSIF